MSKKPKEKESARGRRITVAAIFAVVCVAACAVIAAVFAQRGGDGSLRSGDYVYEITDDGVVIVEYTGNSRDEKIPGKLGGKPVTGIGENSFEGNGELRTVEIPSGITYIGKGAFRACPALEKADVSESVEEIGEEAFYLCGRLKTLEGCEGVDSVGKKAFDATAWFKAKSDCAVYVGNVLYRYVGGTDAETFLSLKIGVKELAYRSLYGCSVSGIALPSALLKIGDEAFYACSNLSYVVIPMNVSIIGENAFAGCTSMVRFGIATGNVSFASKDDVLFTSGHKELIRYPAAKDSAEYSIPDDTQLIRSGAFADSASLKSVKISSSVTAIGDGAFLDCTLLSELSIPDSVKKIGEHAVGFAVSGGQYAPAEGFTIICSEGSAAQEYAEQNGISYRIK